ncbi:MBL fold metallo-hydrolase [Acidobacteria bacterium AH-259-D05]|nr:MBL fold metallo-hydrolase [Acidobacteria bacterium AH-259-D05]
MMRRIILIQLVLGLCFCVGQLAAQEDAKVEVEKVAEGVYIFSHNIHRSLFVVRDDMVLVTDPQTTDTAKRYLEEIRKITQAPIRYLVYSHRHGDHISGGQQLGSGFVTIGHVNMVGRLDSTRYGKILPPDVTFSDKLSIFLSDLEVQLIYPGPNETDDNIIVFVPDRKVAFMADTVGVRRLPWRTMSGANPYDWRDALKTLVALDFDILAPGHGRTGNKSDVQEYIQYFDDLISAVKQRMERGQSLEEIQESLKLPKYSDWIFYDDFLKLNIEAVHGQLSKM